MERCNFTLRTALVLATALGALVVCATPAVADEPQERTPERSGVQVAAGIGVATVRATQLGTSRALTGPRFDARVSWPIGQRFDLGAEFGFYALNDDAPLDSDISLDGQTLVTHRFPKVLQTRTMMAFVQWNHASGFFLKPSVGFSRNSYAAYLTHPTVEAMESAELGLAFGVAAGREWRVTRRFGLAVEGGFVYAGTEDSSVARKIFTVQVVPLLRAGGR
jgi:hypothetical protein